MKPWIRSAGAIAAGFLVTAVASVAADAIMHATGVFPSSPRAMSDALLFSLRDIARSSQRLEVS